MTDMLLALVPEYGLWLIFAVVALSCLAVPLPASVLVLSAGGFAAAGDLVLWEVLGAAFAGFVLGDQTAFQIARHGGRPVVERLRGRRKLVRLIGRAEAMLEKSGAVAVFLSRTVVSPMGPYMSYIAGAAGLSWLAYSSASVPGAALWVTGYSLIGYGAADNLTQFAELTWNGIGVIAALAVFIGAVFWLRRSLRKFREAEAVKMAGV